MGGAAVPVPYWNVNVPEDRWTEDCPDFLLGISAKDRGIISTPDEQYHIDTWPEVRARVEANRLELFRRVPSELRRYREWLWKLNHEYGTVMDFILAQRLHWDAPIVARGAPFEFGDDLKILFNDWPYGIDKRIVHLVVWTKFALEEDPVTGDLTARARAEVDTYVDETFRSRIPRDHVIWFKNWAALKSVRSVEHLHVMLFDPAPDFINEITNGDKPFCQKAAATISPPDTLPTPPSP